MSHFYTVFLLAVAGGLGAVSRHLIEQLPFFKNRTHLAILLINTVGSFAIGFSVGSLAIFLPATISLAFNVGFLGGFTTLGSSSFIIANMILDKKYTPAIFIALVQVIFGVLLAFFGLWIAAIR